MTDQTLPVCRLCKSAPLSGGQLGDDLYVRHTENSCPVNGKRIFKISEWTALMGVDRDAVRYRKFRGMVGSYPTPSGEAFLFPTAHGMPAPTIAILDPAKGLDDALDAMGEQQ